MSSLFKKSPERVAERLFTVCSEVGRNMGRANFLQIPDRSVAYVRYAISCDIFSNLMCQDMFEATESDKVRVLGISKRLMERHLASLCAHGSTPVPITDIVVWENELVWISTTPINPAFAGAYVHPIRAPLSDIVRELYVVRLMRMVTDLLNGATLQLQRSGFSLAHLMPACSSLIMQITADEQRATDEQTVARFAASVLPHWMLLHALVQAASR